MNFILGTNSKSTKLQIHELVIFNQTTFQVSRSDEENLRRWLRYDKNAEYHP
jgi:hypothetical protein